MKEPEDISLAQYYEFDHKTIKHIENTFGKYLQIFQTTILKILIFHLNFSAFVIRVFLSLIIKKIKNIKIILRFQTEKCYVPRIPGAYPRHKPWGAKGA